MNTFRRLTVIALASAAALSAAPAFAGSNHGGVGGVPNQYDYPPNTEPGQCYSRRVTGAGGAYRWDRIECDSAYSGYGYGYGQGGYGDQVQVQSGYGYQAAADCGCAGYRPVNPCNPCQAYAGGYQGGGYQGGGYQGGYAGGGGYTSDRYGERRYSQSQYEQSQDQQSQYQYESSSYGSDYAYGRGGQGVNYPPPYGYGYVAAGRDEAGYLIWPGKAP